MLQVIRDLQERLKSLNQLTPPLINANFNYGTNSDFLKKFVNYWLTRYDWRQREEILNKYPQYKTNVSGLGIHFIHVKPEVHDNVIIVPLLMLHGWPSSVREFYTIIPLLTTNRKSSNIVFEVICPSLPGFGFSDATIKQGLGGPEVAIIMKRLMQRLGFETFYVHGNGWGASVADYMAVLFPET